MPHKLNHQPTNQPTDRPTNRPTFSPLYFLVSFRCLPLVVTNMEFRIKSIQSMGVDFSRFAIYSSGNIFY